LKERKKNSFAIHCEGRNKPKNGRKLYSETMGGAIDGTTAMTWATRKARVMASLICQITSKLPVHANSGIREF
jgi:hypothetical protein